MKKVFFLLIILTLISGGVFVFGNLSNYKNQQAGEKDVIPASATGRINTPTSIRTSIPTIKETVMQAPPVKIQIPAIKVDAEIEQVGLDSKNRMDVPREPENAGWFSLGYKPGETGNAVIAGHLDKITGEKAVFWSINQLKRDDEIIVLDSKGQKQVYGVTGISNYPYDKFPLKKVFGQAKNARLNLITCRGKWDKSSQNYSERTVVYSELKTSSLDPLPSF